MIRQLSTISFVFLFALNAHAIAQLNKQTLPILSAEAIKASRPVAEKSLATFADTAKEEDVRELGLGTLADARSAKIGDPIPVVLVRLDKLQAYQISTDPYSLLENVNRIIFPLSVNQVDSSSLEVEKMGDSWETTALGGKELIKLFSSARSRAKATRKASDSTYVAVHIPALNLYFLGEHTDTTFNLTALIDDPLYNLKAGDVLLASRIFERLVPAAKAHDGLPR